MLGSMPDFTFLCELHRRLCFQHLYLKVFFGPLRFACVGKLFCCQAHLHSLLNTDFCRLYRLLRRVRVVDGFLNGWVI